MTCRTRWHGRGMSGFDPSADPWRTLPMSPFQIRRDDMLVSSIEGIWVATDPAHRVTLGALRIDVRLTAATAYQ